MVGCVTVARGGSSAILFFLIWTLTLSLPFVVASSVRPSHVANTNTQLPEGAGRCVGSEGDKLGA